MHAKVCCVAKASMEVVSVIGSVISGLRPGLVLILGNNKWQ